MSARDLAAELAADNAKSELEALRELRKAVLDATWAVARVNGHHATAEDRARTCIYFDAEGCGPFVTLHSAEVFELAALARKAVAQ